MMPSYTWMPWRLTGVARSSWFLPISHPEAIMQTLTKSPSIQRLPPYPILLPPQKPVITLADSRSHSPEGLQTAVSLARKASMSSAGERSLSDSKTLDVKKQKRPHSRGLLLVLSYFDIHLLIVLILVYIS